ncbi:MAG: hypothetical protein AAGJ82_00805 [Bacteroidota bacterium]
MRYSLLLLSVLTLLTFSCDGPQEPEITGFKNVRTTKVTKNEIVIVADLVGFNPNPVGGTVSDTDVIVTVNGVETAAVVQDKDAEIAADGEFMIPLVCSVSPERLFKEDRNGLIGGLLNAALNRKVDVEYQGELKLKVAGITFEEPIDYKEEIKIK